MGLGESQPVVFHVVADSSLDLLDVVAASRYHAHHVYPEGIFHTAAHKGAVVLFCQNIQMVGPNRICGPAVGGLLAGGDDADTPA